MKPEGRGDFPAKEVWEYQRASTGRTEKTTKPMSDSQSNSSLLEGCRFPIRTMGWSWWSYLLGSVFFLSVGRKLRWIVAYESKPKKKRGGGGVSRFLVYDASIP
ncbi:hypothetical protein BHE74_00043977 [Ensete ventricosum]|nr:hypothetical protein BHE74_00043977 [Ensete ventricosum]